MTKRSKRTSLDTITTPTPTADPPAEVSSQANRVERRPPPSERGGGTVYRPPGGVKGKLWRRVRQIAFENDTTAQAILTEGLMLYLSQSGEGSELAVKAKYLDIEKS